MHRIARPLFVFAAAALIQAAFAGVTFAQNNPPRHPPVPGVAPPSSSGPGWSTEEEPLPAAENESQADLPVLYVTNVEILRTSAQPELVIVSVTGLAASEGWAAPLLVPTYAGKPFDGILDLELIATPPEQSEPAGGFVQISAIFPLEQGQILRGVRVRGSENAITVRQIPGSSQVTISVNDCANCVGKKFAPDGSAPQPQEGVVRQEDLPKSLRIIKESDGIRGVEQDPNRLSLILGEDNTILEAYWE